ncbi:hypothetical protein SELMODRAFT_419876 [Selaginella moellendorffii]|uniref:Uncharacterized protein n=1 Tax=Selaginella moellendorffii TaxID=88036 RepID=D8SAU0_SELML|nr:hypothetical protein SELMODRAFT_419876 [Selaginella moellendorffii]
METLDSKIRVMLRSMKNVPVTAPRNLRIGHPEVSPLGDFMYPIEYPEPPTAQFRCGLYALVRSEFYHRYDHGKRMMRHLYTITREGGDVEKYQVVLAEDSLGETIKGFSRMDWEDCAIPENGELRQGERRCSPRREMTSYEVPSKAVERLDLMMSQDRIFPSCRNFVK